MTVPAYSPPDWFTGLPRGNALVYSSDLSQAAWTKTNATIVSAIADPFGGTAAQSLSSAASGNDSVGQSITDSAANLTYTFSVWLKLGTLGGTVMLLLKDGAGVTAATYTATVTSTWTRFSVTGAFPSTATAGVQVLIDPTTNPTASGQTVLIYGPQLEQGLTAESYISTTSTAAPSIWGTSVFPYLPGQHPEIEKDEVWATKVMQASSGRERRTAMWAFPRYKFKVTFEVLRKRATLNEVQVLEEFFNIAQGKFGRVQILDPSDNYVSAGLMSLPGQAVTANGDGSTTTFQLTRKIRNWIDPIYSVYTPTFQATVNGANVASTVSSVGLVTFSSAPANGATIAWTGYFYYLARFDQDEMNMKAIWQQLWSQSGLTFMSERP